VIYSSARFVRRWSFRIQLFLVLCVAIQGIRAEVTLRGDTCCHTIGYWSCNASCDSPYRARCRLL